MSTTFQPFGLKPVYHPSGLDRAEQFAGTNTFNTGTTFTAPYSLSAGQSFFQYQPVAITSSGELTIANAAAASGKVYGVFNGVEYTSAEGRRSVAKFAAKTTLDAATQIIFWIFRDPALVYEVQVNGSVTTAAIGTEYNFNAAATTPTSLVTSGIAIGNGGAGFSTTALNATAVASGAQGQVRVIGLGRETAFPAGQLNAWGDAFTIVQVQICNNQFAAPSVSV
jgi:hypothetical protein